MAEPRQRRQAAQRPARAAVGIVDEGGGGEEVLCTCCEPRNPLVMRPDLGILPDGSAEYALCVLHEPEPVVYRNRGDGIYEQCGNLALNPAGELVDDHGNVVARVASDGFQRLSTLDDDDQPSPDPPPASGSPGPSTSPGGASRPVTHHVDLSQDDFYR